MLTLLALLALGAGEPARAEGLWPAPPPIERPLAPSGPPVTVLLGVAFGGTNQVRPNVNGLAGLELGLEFDTGPVRTGLLTTLSYRRDAGAFSLGALAGRAYRRPDGRALELLGELGLQGFWIPDQESLFFGLSTRTTSGSGGVLPYLGGRLLFAPGGAEGRGGVAVALFVQQTLGTKDVTYQVTDCAFLNPCRTTDQTVRYGGLAVGISLSATLAFRARGEAAAAPAVTGEGRGPP